MRQLLLVADPFFDKFFISRRPNSSSHDVIYALIDRRREIALGLRRMTSPHQRWSQNSRPRRLVKFRNWQKAFRPANDRRPAFISRFRGRLVIWSATISISSDPANPTPVSSMIMRERLCSCATW
jgi:hypothetical protein